MALNFFGFTIKRKEEELPRSVVPPTQNDGSIVTQSNAGYNSALGDSYNLAFDPDGQIKTEMDLIRRYRELSRYPEVAEAIENIVNEAIVLDGYKPPVSLNLDELKVQESIKKKIHDSFNEILSKLNFTDEGYDIFEKWYIDGKLHYHIILEEQHKLGIAELRQIDPRKIKKIRNIKKQVQGNGIEIVKEIEEYFLYNEKGIGDATTQGLRLSLDSVVYCHSGIVDYSTNLIQQYLHKAIRPANQLKMLEEAVIIYRWTRAPERRVFYIDVGNLPKGKAEEYVAGMMNKFKNKISYDAITGEVVDSKRHLSMMEDFWMPRRGDKSTEITTLPGGQGLGQLDDLAYFKEKLQKSLNVPVSRMQQETGFSIGRSDTISRDEIKFNKFITKLRNKFSQMFMDLLRIQLVAKGILTINDWDQLKEKIKVVYNTDNHFSEMKETEVLNNRLQAVMQLDPFVGKYVSREYIQKSVLRFTEEEVEEMNKVIEEENKKYAEHTAEVNSIMDPSLAQQAPQDNSEGPQQ